MPEGDTVLLAASRMNSALAGGVLTRSDFRVPRLASADLSGRAVVDVVPRGKHMLTRIEGGLTLHTHFRMEGSWRLFRPRQRWSGGPKWEIRAVLSTADITAVGYRLPVVELLATAAENSVVGHLGPDILATERTGIRPGRAPVDAAVTGRPADAGRLQPALPGVVRPSRTPTPDPALVRSSREPPSSGLPVEFWDEGEAVRRLAADPDRPIAAALLDQRNVAGIGNLWAVETCYLRGQHPLTPAGAVDLSAMLRFARRMMRYSADHQARQITTGDPRDPHWVYGRMQLPCRRCRSAIRRRDSVADLEGRVIYWCPSCQPEPAG